MRRIIKIALGAAAGAALLKAILSPRRYSFAGKVILITGGSRGLGLVLARQLGGEGARLVLCARDSTELGRAAEELRRAGVAVATFTGDLQAPETAQQAVSAAVEAFGQLDVLINNAGIIEVGPVETMTEEDYAAAMATHFWAPLRLIYAALPYLKGTRGRIVNISSIGGKIAIPHLAPYCASKFAAAALSDVFRAELAKDGIRVTSVFPGLMRTGSHIQARFKGRRSEEFRWFALGAATPLSSMGAVRAARQIVSACREGRPELVITIQARIAVIIHALFPNLTARILALVNRVLPGVEMTGDALPGWQVRDNFPKLLTAMPDRASRENNETC